jgi:hypothetical protein
MDFFFSGYLQINGNFVMGAANRSLKSPHLAAIRALGAPFLDSMGGM